MLIQQSHRNQRDSKIAGRFQMVARQNAESAGENGNALRQPEFRRKVSHPQSFHLAVGAPVPCGFGSHIGIQFASGSRQVRQKGFVAGQRLQLPLFQQAEHAHGIVPRSLPEIAVQAAEQFDGAMVPGPSKIMGQLPKAVERSRERRHHLERVYGFHCSHYRSYEY